MRGFSRLSAIVVMALLVAPVVAGQVGFLDAERAVFSVDEGKRQQAALEEWAKSRTEELQRMQSEVAEFTNQLNRQRAVAAPEALSELENRVRQGNRALEDADRNFKREVESKQRELLAEVAARVRSVAGEYALENDLDAVFLIDAQPLVYMKETADLTETVIRIYNEKYPVN